MIKLFLVTFLFGINLVYSAEVYEKKGLTWFNLNLSKGNISIVNSDTDLTTISIDGNPGCKLIAGQSGTEFTLEEDKGNSSGGAEGCLFNVSIKTPKEAYPSIEILSGALKLNANLKQLRFVSETSTVNINGEIGDLELSGKDVSANVTGNYRKLFFSFKKGSAKLNLTGNIDSTKAILEGDSTVFSVTLPSGSNLKSVYEPASNVFKIRSSRGFDLYAKTPGEVSLNFVD